jgi:hypothetical protein
MNRVSEDIDRRRQMTLPHDFQAYDLQPEPELTLVQAATRILIAVLVAAALLAVIDRLADAHFDLGGIETIDLPTDPIAMSGFTA